MSAPEALAVAKCELELGQKATLVETAHTSEKQQNFPSPLVSVRR